MQFDEYQQQAIATDLFNGKMESVTDPSFLEKAFGLVGEAGEVAEKLKKLIRDHDGVLNEDRKAEIIKEFGDVLWYISALSLYLNVPLSEVAQGNLEKLAKRKQQGTLNGSGDNR